MGKPANQLPNLPAITREKFMEHHRRLLSMTTPQLEKRIADLRAQEEEIRARWDGWHKAILDKCNPLNERYDSLRRSKQSNAASARTAAAFKKAIKRRWEKLPLFQKWDDKTPALEVWHKFLSALSKYYVTCLLGELDPVTDEMAKCSTHLKNRAYQAAEQTRLEKAA